MFAKALVTNQHALAAIAGDPDEKDKSRTMKDKKKKDTPNKANGHRQSCNNGGSMRTLKAETRIAIEEDLEDDLEDDLTAIPSVCEPTHSHGRSEPQKAALAPPSKEESTEAENEASVCEATIPPPAPSQSGLLRSTEPSSSARQVSVDRANGVLVLLFRSVQVIFMRILFMLHSFITVWRTADILGTRYWLILVGLVALLVETIVTLVTKKGVEGKW